MLASAFVDESVGDDGRLVLAGLIASWDKWRGFGIDWDHLLKQAQVPYAHFYEMDRNKGAFSDKQLWNVARKRAFVAAQADMVSKWCELGVTVSIDLALYREMYRVGLPAKVTPFSAYGVAGLEMFLQVQRHCEQLFSDVDTINFAWERGHQNMPNVQQIFYDLKDCFGKRAQTLGAFIPLKRDEAPALSVVDQLCVSARRMELTAKAHNMFGVAPPDATLADIQAMLPDNERMPIFHHEIGKARMAELQAMTVDIVRRRKLLKAGQVPE